MKFDDPDPKKHDVVLVVDGQKFYCSKSTLSRHTNYFNSMFFAGYVEKSRKEINLEDPRSPEEFQIFLETVHGVKCLTDDNVHGVLRLSVAWCADIVRNRCIDFLMGEETEKTLKERFDMSIELIVPQLMEFILLQINRTFEINVMLFDHDFKEIPQPIVGMVFEKYIQLSKPTPPSPQSPVVHAPQRGEEDVQFLAERAPVRARRRQDWNNEGPFVFRAERLPYPRRDNNNNPLARNDAN